MLNILGEGLFGLKVNSPLYVGAAGVNTVTLCQGKSLISYPVFCKHLLTDCLFTMHKLHELMPFYPVKYSKPIFLN